MTRSPVETSVATPDDIDMLAKLWDELRQVGARSERAINPAAIIDVQERLAAILDDPRCRVVAARIGDRPAGMVVLRIVTPDPLADSQVVQVAHLVVARGLRHRGVGQALVLAAADFAVERHVEHVAAGVYPSLREASRFFARLGFAPAAVHRVAPVNVLRRRLGADRAAPGTTNGVVRRRSLLMRPVPPQRSKARDRARAASLDR